MADTEDYLHLKYFIYCFLTIVTFCNSSEANIIQKPLSENRLVVEIEASSLPVFKRPSKRSVESSQIFHNLRKRDLTQDSKCQSQNGNLKTATIAQTVSSSYILIVNVVMEGCRLHNYLSVSLKVKP